jgi:tetratricopeptide (TPR) repeat protein
MSVAMPVVHPIQPLQLNFDNSSVRKLFVMRTGRDAQARRDAEVEEMFLSAVQFAENPATIPHAMKIYRAILAMQPEHAPALINLGTIHYNLSQYEQAEQHYRRATVADPEYALAFFDLGNVLDEMQRLTEATEAFQKAVALYPRYADAHYNLARSYERQGHRRRALLHWLTYVRLDPTSPWAKHAREQARKILSTEPLSIVSRRGQLVKASRIVLSPPIQRAWHLNP